MANSKTFANAPDVISDPGGAEAIVQVYSETLFTSHLRALISHLEAGHSERAGVLLGDATEFLQGLLTSPLERCKSGTRSAGSPISAENLGTHRVEATMIALGKIRMALEYGQFRTAFADAKDALDQWETNHGRWTAGDEPRR